jgi:hypothetical protein
MQSTRRIPFKGTIRGHGGEAECSGWVDEISLSGQPPDYARYRIERVFKPLPDGDYTLFAHGAAQSVRLQNGQWGAASAMG